MRKLPKLLAAILAVGFVVGVGAVPVEAADATLAHHHHALLDTGWD